MSAISLKPPVFGFMVGGISGAFGYYWDSWQFWCFGVPAILLYCHLYRDPNKSKDIAG